MGKELGRVKYPARDPIRFEHISVWLYSSWLPSCNLVFRLLFLSGAQRPFTLSVLLISKWWGILHRHRSYYPIHRLNLISLLIHLITCPTNRLDYVTQGPHCFVSRSLILSLTSLICPSPEESYNNEALLYFWSFLVLPPLNAKASYPESRLQSLSLHNSFLPPANLPISRWFKTSTHGLLGGSAG